MAERRKIAGQRQVVLEQLKTNSSDIVFELLSDILSIEREHRDHKRGVVDAVRSAIDRVATHDLPGDRESQ